MFAGVAVWSYALRRAGWPDDRPVWTGSCPCQPFSAAGKGLGFEDERHLWPAWYWLIGERRPPVVFGEQVASSAVEPWIDLVHADVEALDYAFGCVPFPSAGVGSPHIRDRAYWMAYTDRRKRRGLAVIRGAERDRPHAGRPEGRREPESRSAICRLADDHQHGRAAQAGTRIHDHKRHAQSRGSARGLANADDDGFQGGSLETVRGTGRRQEGHATGRSGSSLADGFERIEPAGPPNGFWRAADWLLCRDGKWRPVEPGTFPLADGAPSRVGRLRAYGNAINAEAATQFILAAREILTT
nr:DNA cytosine methyltransferase [Burkholderia ubonensis]